MEPAVSVQVKPVSGDADKSKEYAYGPKANKNFAPQSRSDMEPRRSSGAPNAADQPSAPENSSARSDWRQSASSQPSSARSFQVYTQCSWRVWIKLIKILIIGTEGASNSKRQNRSSCGESRPRFECKSGPSRLRKGPAKVPFKGTITCLCVYSWCFEASIFRS